MKSLPWLLFLGILLSPLSAAQAQAPVEDVLGVHANGGRGCVGCHPPHYNPALMGPAIAALAGQELWFGDGGGVSR
jgi:mono/diheme cytochrome c family protein